MRATSKTAPRRPVRRPSSGAAPDPRHRLWWRAGIALATVGALAALYAVFSTSSSGRTGGQGAYDVGSPGPGTPAPGFALTSSTGHQLQLADLRGKNTLLYFQEGLTCQPCWDQLTDLEKDAAKVKAAGIDDIVSITTDPADLIARKTRDMHLATPVLSDPDLAVSKVYRANDFGMMGASRDGHTFVLVGPDGTIRWRADYGGAPDYTMYVPVARLLADLAAGTHR
ncbi:peroxiredoxin family protein [Streptomyces sp. H10-C2]|uniref:peroxiredoxin family protein n=1 Tax=unclassified Streptomyces TaxID=2593676 RepID=UPI0024BA017D|nr:MULTISPECIES: peroxiredoxin family protein [unclassified Streptomyces]MDJ0341044.1 peroxiredoxin family protein [Streptomyces sp. PH10-H1]MDJ0369724.1 peroxiredoxin family protein [Streptomyces sp. H10-C2]